jgi:hypothetical protein
VARRDAASVNAAHAVAAESETSFSTLLLNSPVDCGSSTDISSLCTEAYRPANSCSRAAAVTAMISPKRPSKGLLKCAWVDDVNERPSTRMTIHWPSGTASA